MNSALRKRNLQNQPNRLEVVSRSSYLNGVSNVEILEPILEAQNLSLSFTQYTDGLQQNELQVISNLNVKIYPGEIVAVVGSNGSGKSLIADTILAILPENASVSGSLRYKGQELNRELQSQLREEVIAVDYLDPLMRVGEQVDYSIKWSSSKHAREMIFDRYNLNTEVEYLLSHEFSEGISRRVSLSTVVQSDTQLIIAEEPTHGFNPIVLEEVLNHFCELADERRAILLITHDINTALTIADQITVLYAGTTVK